MPSHFEERKKKGRELFSLEDQVFMFDFFIRHWRLKRPVYSELVLHTHKDERALKSWWYNRRSDVHDGIFKPPTNVRVVLEALYAREGTTWEEVMRAEASESGCADSPCE